MLRVTYLKRSDSIGTNMKIGDLIMFKKHKNPDFNKGYFSRDMEAQMVFKVVSVSGDKVTISGVGYDGEQIDKYNLVCSNDLRVVNKDIYAQTAFECGVSRRDAKSSTYMTYYVK